MKVQQIGNGFVYVVDGEDIKVIATKPEAIQLAKGLLMACDVPYITKADERVLGKHLEYVLFGPKTASEDTDDSPGLNLDEIHSKAREIHARYAIGTMGLDYDVCQLALLIANLAARMKEQKEERVYTLTCDALKLQYKCSNCGYEDGI